MPGFAVGPFIPNNSINQKAPSRADYFYNYTWYAPRVVGYAIGVNPSLIHLKEATLPTFTVGVEKYLGGSVEYKHAKSVSWDDVKFSWYDTQNLLPTIRRWRMSVWSAQDGLRPASEYKDTTELTVYLPNGQYENMWKLYGSWPSSIKYGDLTYSSSDVKSIEVTLSYDYAAEFSGKSEIDSEGKT